MKKTIKIAFVVSAMLMLPSKKIWAKGSSVLFEDLVDQGHHVGVSEASGQTIGCGLSFYLRPNGKAVFKLSGPIYETKNTWTGQGYYAKRSYEDLLLKTNKQTYRPSDYERDRVSRVAANSGTEFFEFYSTRDIFGYLKTQRLSIWVDKATKSIVKFHFTLAQDNDNLSTPLNRVSILRSQECHML